MLIANIFVCAIIAFVAFVWGMKFERMLSALLFVDNVPDHARIRAIVFIQNWRSRRNRGN
jgi:hypothetical protein